MESRSLAEELARLFKAAGRPLSGEPFSQLLIVGELGWPLVLSADLSSSTGVIQRSCRAIAQAALLLYHQTKVGPFSNFYHPVSPDDDFLLFCDRLSAGQTS